MLAISKTGSRCDGQIITAYRKRFRLNLLLKEIAFIMTKLTANSGWAWRGVGKACWKRDNAARSTLNLSARYSRNEVAGAARPDQAA